GAKVTEWKDINTDFKNTKHPNAALEPGARHSYAEASGRDIASPTAILLASCKLLRHINLKEHPAKLLSAIY
ncbi:hypothetical protein X801_04819, partial [Opisthorchis viverrini]